LRKARSRSVPPALVGWLKLDEDTYRSLVAIAEHVGADPEFRELHRVVSRGLSRVQFLTADGLRYLLGPYLEEE
jgi:hypothetical protein